ncbi:MAG: DUF1801 domain-containing protein [Candidatus Andersenbacteria bacterium]
MHSNAKTVAAYLKALPPDRAKAVRAVRAVILKHLPRGYQEAMQWGMITYQIPLTRKPDTYNGQPLALAALASQKNYLALYLMNVYGDKATERWFKARYKASGKKLDMGKSCVRFKRLEDLPLDLIGETIARTSVESYLKRYEQLKPTKKSSKKSQ